MNKKVLKIIRVALLVLALINIVLVSFGIEPIKIDDQTLANFINDGFAIVMAIWCCWKNFSVTTPAIKADEVMKALKAGIDVIIQYQNGGEAEHDVDELTHENDDPEDWEED